MLSFSLYKLLKRALLHVCCLHVWAIACQETQNNSPNESYTPLFRHFPGSNSYPSATDMPETNVTRRYSFVVQRKDTAPDGVSRSLLLVNGVFPGPLIEADWGDQIEVYVQNAVLNPMEEIALHWHGQPQRLSPWMDGTPAVTQCPIAPGSSFTYRFRAESYGTGWYHSHISGQLMDGLFGPMIIHGPSNVSYDHDIGPVMLHDYIHESHTSYISAAFEKPPRFLALDNNLINGKNPFNCSLITSGAKCSEDPDNYSHFVFEPGKWHRLRLINGGSTDNQKFTIDNHTMTVIAQDYVPLRPYNTTVVTLAPGQRSDILVYGSGSRSEAFWMRSDLDTTPNCGNSSTIISEAKAVIYYPGASGGQLPTSAKTPWTSNSCRNDDLSLQVPSNPQTPPPKPSTTINMEIRFFMNETGYFLFYLNNRTFRGDYNAPLLSLAQMGNTSYPEIWNTYNFGQNTSIRVIWYNYFPGPHPMHLHGHDFWILAEGTGTWDGNIVNPMNPARRDTHSLAPGSFDGNPLTSTVPSYVVVEWLLDNPGVWPFHCHITTHSSYGFLFNSIERPEDIRNMSYVPQIMQETCRDWSTWSSRHNVDEIDSGL